MSKCCSCNGSNAKCVGCVCVRNNVSCTSCYPKRHGRCQNTDSVSILSASRPTPSVIVNRDHVCESGQADDSNATKLTSSNVEDLSDPTVFKPVVQAIRSCRSSQLKHIPKSSRFQFAKSLAKTIDSALAQNNYVSWARLLLFPTFCLRSPPHNGRKHSRKLCNIINERIAIFGDTADVDTLLKSIGPTRLTSHNKKRRNQEQQLRSLVSGKIKDGDVRGAVRIVSSEDNVAPYTPTILSTLQAKHPTRPSDRRPFPKPSQLHSFTVDENSVIKAIKSFPTGSAGGITRLRPQHLKESLSIDASSQRDQLLTTLTDLTNAIISNKLPRAIKAVLLGANVTALNKRDGGIRPIAVGETFRRIACKCAVSHSEQAFKELFAPSQLGCGVRAGLDAAIHFTRNRVSAPREGEILVKLDFKNAFNTIRRDHIAECLDRYAPHLLDLFIACYSEPTMLTYGDLSFESDEGLQQGDPLAPALFCLGLHDALASVSGCSLKIAYLDDVTLLGQHDSLLADLKKFILSCKAVGLELNSSKCELSVIAGSLDPAILNEFKVLLPNLIFVPNDKITLLGAALGENSLETLILDSQKTFEVLGSRLKILSCHDALFLLRNCFYLPKLLHQLRTSPSFTRTDLLLLIDESMMHVVSSILNVELSDFQKRQVVLPAKLSGLGISSASFIAASAFLSSLYASDSVCQLISCHWKLEEAKSHVTALEHWYSQCTVPSYPLQPLTKQKSWTLPLHRQSYDELLRNSKPLDRTRLLSCASKGSGDWINVLPSTSLGLHLTDDQLRVASAIRIGAPVSIEHICARCGSKADGGGAHGFVCPRSKGRHLRHTLMNEVVDRAMHSIQLPTMLEPNGLLLDKNLKPDGISLSPWELGKPIAWDVTCAHPSAKSWSSTTSSGGSVATAVEKRKSVKYCDLYEDFAFQPVSVETYGAYGEQTFSFLRKLGSRIAAKTGEKDAWLYLRQRLAIAIQIGNCACIVETLPAPGAALPDLS